MSDIIRILNDEILPRVKRAEVFAELDPRDRGDYIECKCPACGERTAFIYKNATHLGCNRRSNCGHGINIYAYLNGGTAPQGEAWWRVTEKLATMAGVVLPEYGSGDDIEIAAATTKRSAIEQRWEYAKAHITAEDAQKFLKSRGLKEDGLGYDPDTKDIIIPVFDRYNVLRGCIRRDTTGTRIKDKYLNDVGLPLKEIGFIGLDVALKHKDQGIIIVEGLIDRIHLNQVGVMNVVALGNASVTKDKLELLCELGVRKIILALDNDEAGKKGTRAAIDRAYELLIPPEVLVYTHMTKDADEDLRESFLWEISLAKPCHEWLAIDFIDQYPDKEDLIKAIAKWDRTITSPLRIAHESLHFIPVIEEHLGLTESLMELYAAHRYNNIQEKSNNIIQEAAFNAKKLGAEGKHEKAKDALFEGYRDSEALVRTSKLQPVRTLNERLSDHENHILKYRDCEILGLRCDIDALTDALLGLRGLIFLGGGPNLGKTVLATQLATGILKKEESACVVYINLDMDTDDLITRIRCHMGQFEWKNYICGHDIPIDSGRANVQRIGNRMVVLDEKCFTGEVTEVLEVARDLKEKSGCSRVLIVLDYLQVWEVPEDQRKILRTPNEIDEWRVAIVKQLKNSVQKHDAVLVISEVNKESYNQELDLASLKGSTRLSYAADVVLLLQRLLDDDLLENFEVDGSKITQFTPKRDIGDIKEDGKLKYTRDEKPKYARKVREWFEERSMTVARLHVAKGRDGTLRPRIPITAFFKTATIVEGFHTNGQPSE